MKHKDRLYVHRWITQWGFNYWESYAPVVNWISVRSILAIASIHELPSISIDFLLDFGKAYIDMDVFMEISLGIGVGGNRGESLIKLKNNFMESSKQVQIGFIL